MASNPRALLVATAIAFVIGLAAFAGCLNVTPTKPFGCKPGDCGVGGSTSSTTPSSGGSNAGGSNAGGSNAGGAGGS